jgi:hypothetical protein
MGFTFSSQVITQFNKNWQQSQSFDIFPTPRHECRGLLDIGPEGCLSPPSNEGLSAVEQLKK